jgi:hypothetical protein
MKAPRINKTHLLFLGAFLIVAVIVVIGSALWPQGEASQTQTSSSIPDPTTNWKTYRNEKYGFGFRYPPYLQTEKTSIGSRNQSLNSDVQGKIDAFSDGRAEKLAIFVTNHPLDGYIVRDVPGGVYYTFREEENQWISSVRGEMTGREPKLMSLPIVAYDYSSGDGICGWRGAVLSHPNKRIVVEFIYAICVDEGELPGPMGYRPDLTAILSTLFFLE